jgi:RNA polymerase sigma factor (sigma-70 family)
LIDNKGLSSKHRCDLSLNEAVLFGSSNLTRVASDEDTPEAALVRKAEAQTVHLILNAMPRPFREIPVLREIEELSYHQISEITALPIGTVMSRLARARKAFGDAWNREAAASG